MWTAEDVSEFLPVFQRLQHVKFNYEVGRVLLERVKQTYTLSTVNIYLNQELNNILLWAVLFIKSRASFGCIELVLWLFF